ELFRQILPASATAQNPQNAFEHLAVGGSRPSAASPRTWTRKQGPDLLPLGVGQQTTVSRHRPSIGAAVLVYLAFPSTQLPQNSGFAPSFETASSPFRLCSICETVHSRNPHATIHKDVADRLSGDKYAVERISGA